MIRIFPAVLLAGAMPAAAAETSVLACGARGDGVHDDSAAIQNCIDAHRGGTVVLPANRTFLAAGIVLDGPAYAGTTIVVRGIFMLAPSGGRYNWNLPRSPIWAGIVLHRTTGVTIDVPGMMDGNRLRQAAGEQHHLLALWGAVDTRIPRFRAREVRGDGIFITTATNLAPFANNSIGVTIGSVDVRNTIDDGRNAVSIISGERIKIARVTSDRVGGIIAGRRMPGGVDLETDGDWHRISNVTIGAITVRTAGTSGLAVLGSPIGNSDRAEQWTVARVTIAAATVTQTGPGGPIIRRAHDVRVRAALMQGTHGAPWTFDFIDGLNADIVASGGTSGVELGRNGFVRRALMRIDVRDHEGPAVLAGGVADSDIQVRERDPRGGTTAVLFAPFGRNIIQSRVTWGIDAPPHPQLTGLSINRGVTLGPGTTISRAATAYPAYAPTP